MYELFDTHGRKKTVARILNERGLRTRDGSNWSDTSVDRLLQDPTAKGIHRANYTRRVAGNKPWALKPEHEWILTPVDALVSEELWQKCNDNLEARKTKLARPTKHVTHLFAGLAFCKCGKKMYVPSNSPKYVCTGCRNKIPIEDLSAVFLDELKNYLVSPDKVTAYLESANASIGEKTQLLDILRSELEKVKQQAEQTYQLYLKQGLTVEQFKGIYQPLDARKKQIEADIPPHNRAGKCFLPGGIRLSRPTAGAFFLQPGLSGTCRAAAHPQGIRPVRQLTRTRWGRLSGWCGSKLLAHCHS
jgi:site-specific DNA recombinase